MGASGPSVLIWHRVSMPLHVRTMAVDDLEWCHALNEANVPALGTETREAFDQLLELSSIALVATVDGERAGFTICMLAGAAYESMNYRWFISRHDTLVYLDRVAVDARFKGRGVGRALYDEVDRLGLALTGPGVPFCLEVNLEPRNDDSLAFHDRLGFAEVGQQRTPNGKLVSMMERPIGASHI